MCFPVNIGLFSYWNLAEDNLIMSYHGFDVVLLLLYVIFVIIIIICNCVLSIHKTYNQFDWMVSFETFWPWFNIWT